MSGFRNIILYIVFIYIYLWYPIPAFSEDIPVLDKVDVNAVIKYDTTSNTFLYNYQITNHDTNTGAIRNFQIDITRSSLSQELSSKNLFIQLGMNPKGEIMARSYDEELDRLSQVIENLIVPVGVKPPDNWTAGISNSGTVTWGSKNKTSRILPGSSLSGFEVVSPGLPGIKSFLVKPHWVLVVDGFVSEDDIEKSRKIKEEIALKGNTIGPTAPPLDLVPIDFVDYIISLKHEAFAQGWITNQGIVKSLDAKLDNAKKKLAQSNNKAAINILEAFINEVEAQGCETYDNCQKGKHIKPEAYALLKYNAEYLIGNIQ